MNFTEDLWLQLAILSFALLLDLSLGEPVLAAHPTVWMGRTAEFLKTRVSFKGPNLEKFQGALLALSVIGASIILAYYSLILCRMFLGLIPYIALSTFLLKASISAKSMGVFTLPIARAAEDGNYGEARRLLRTVVRRDPQGLSDQQVLSATVETIAEGTVDGVTGSLFFYSILGVPAAIGYRAVNTLDSTVGYKDRKHLHIGWFSAKLDTLANYIPARATGLLTVISARLVNADWRGCLEALRAYHGKTESLNAGWSMSAMAGALGVMLEKPGSYRLGKPSRVLQPADIPKALKIMKVNILLFVLFISIPLTVLSRSVALLA